MAPTANKLSWTTHNCNLKSFLSIYSPNFKNTRKFILGRWQTKKDGFLFLPVAADRDERRFTRFLSRIMSLSVHIYYVYSR